MGSCAAPSAKGDDKFITTDYLQQCPCSYLLKEETPDESIRAEVFSYIPRQKLAEIITLVREIARPSDDNFHEEMVEQYGRVRRFLPHLLNTVKFSSAPAGVTTLNACDYLSREFSSRRQFFDDAPTEIISRSWKRLVINKEKHITRRGYTLCFLSKLQDSLRRRDVYVALLQIVGGDKLIIPFC